MLAALNCGRIKVLMFICSSITAKLKGDDENWFGCSARNVCRTKCIDANARTSARARTGQMYGNVVMLVRTRPAYASHTVLLSHVSIALTEKSYIRFFFSCAAAFSLTLNAMRSRPFMVHVFVCVCSSVCVCVCVAVACRFDYMGSQNSVEEEEVE